MPSPEPESHPCPTCGADIPGPLVELTRVDRLTNARDRMLTLLTAETDGSKAAALSRELRTIDSELAEHAAPKQGSIVDDLAAARAGRKSGPPRPTAARVRQ